MLRFLLRDLFLTALCVGAFVLDAELRALDTTLVSVLVALASGVLAATVGFLVHEWGHLAGALATKSIVHMPTRLASVFLFHFDTRVNDRQQFLAMSLGGFVGSALGLAALFASMPLDALSGKVGAALAALGVLATLVLELPTYVRVQRGAPLPDGFVYEPF